MRMSLILSLTLCAAVIATAQTVSTPTAAFVIPEEKSKPVIIPKFDKPPTIDGKLDEEVWQKAAVLKDFYQIQPGELQRRSVDGIQGYRSRNRLQC